MRPANRKLKNFKHVTIKREEIFKSFFKKKSNKFYPSEINIKVKHKRSHRKQHLELRFCNKILITFLTVYFRDLIFKNFDQYFFFGGRLKAVSLPINIKWQNKRASIDSHRKNIGYIWYRRANKRTRMMVSIEKNRGTSKISKIEEEAYEKNMLDLFPIFRKTMMYLKRNKLMISNAFGNN